MMMVRHFNHELLPRLYLHYLFLFFFVKNEPGKIACDGILIGNQLPQQIL